MDNLILLLITNLFRTYLIRRFIGIFFDIETVGKVKSISCYGSFYALTSLVFLAFHFPPFNIAVNIIGIFLITCIYKGKIKKKIVVSALIYIVNMLCDIIASFLFADYIYGQVMGQAFSIVTDLLILVCELIAERIMLERGKSDVIPPHINKLIFVPLISIIMESILFSNNLENRFLVEALSVGILLINMLIFYLYFCLQESYEAKINEEILKKQLDMYKKQLEIISNSEKKVKSLKHDLKHHITELKALTLKGKATEINEYLMKMEEYFDETSLLVSSGNYGMDSLLNYMLDKAKNTLTDVRTDIKIPENMNLQKFELNMILGNLLENAIQAAKDSDRKFLKINIRVDAGLLLINIQNSYNGKIETKDNHIISSKKGKKDKGIGLNNVLEVVEKNKGYIDIDYKNQIFIVKVMLYLSQTE